MSKNLVTIKVDKETFSRIKEHYKSFLIPNEGEYVDFMAVYGEILITGYTSKKSKFSIVFKGEHASEEADEWVEKPLVDLDSVVEKKEELHYVDFGEQIGSDEVGVGDYLLPMIVVAAYLRKDQYPLLKALGVADSKKLSDKKIREIAPQLMKEIEFSKLTLPNEKYNEMYEKGENINSLKAKMHNRALSNLHQKYIDVIAIYVDQFVKEDTYYKYLSKDDEPIVRGISFKTKGEQRFPSVALASVIARYAFLLEKDKLEEKYGMSFPCGAGVKVDEFKKIFLAKFGQEEYDKLVKKNFKNYSSN